MILSLLLLAFYTSSIRAANPDSVDFVQTQIEGVVKDMMWCG